MVKLFWGLVLCVPLAAFADTGDDFKRMFGGEWYDNPSCKGEVAYEYSAGHIGLYYFPRGTNDGAGVSAFPTSIKRNKDGSYTVKGAQFNTDKLDSFTAVFKGNGKKMTIKGHQKKAKINVALYNCGSKYKSIADM